MNQSFEAVRRSVLPATIGALLAAAGAMGASMPGHANNALENAERVEGVHDMDARRVSDIDLAAEVAGHVPPGASQLSALDAFRESHPDVEVRWDAATGSVDLMHGFATEQFSGTPREAALSFIAEHAGMLGVTDIDALVVDDRASRAALGGHLLRFEQTHDGVPVRHAGIGVVLDGDNRVRAVSGPFHQDLDIATAPSLTGAEAVAAANEDLSGYGRNLPAEALDLLEPAYAQVESQLGGLLTQPHPELAVVPVGGSYRLAWKFFNYSRSPFGLFRYHVDAHTGDILARENQVRTQEEAVEQSADYFPTSPPITPQLQEDGAIVDANGEEVGRPLGQIRVTVRGFDESNRTTGTEGLLTGDNALIVNALPTKQPFAQAGAGTYHFAQDDPPVEARTNERDQLAEPAEHQDAISQFIYITSLMEYLDYLHVTGDAEHSLAGEGHFPDSYPNSDNPLTGVVHVPNILEDACGTLPPATDPTFTRRLLACDNAFAIPLATTVAGEEVVVNPTFYGHGYLFNDLALDFAVPLHEGTHATITPIAGFEGSPEGGALNEGQADLFAYTIGEDPSLGAYIVNAFRLRDQLAAEGVDPDSFAWIRNADSQLRYSQLGTRGNQFEVHRDGEIYAGAMWDLRQLMTQFETGGPFKRPNPVTGEPTDSISLGKETWERIFLGSMYVLGTMAPDTFVRARDAAIIADAILYPADPVDPASPGRHRALIEQVFAARQLGANAAAPQGGRQTISTGVSAFTASQARPEAPQNVTAEPAGTDRVTLRWDSVPEAFAYQVLKRRTDSASRRLFDGVPGREYFDGDDPEQLAGFTHVEYTFGNAATVYDDAGQALGRSPGLGLDSFNFDYVVRAIRENDNGQVGFSDLSGTAELPLEAARVTDALDADIANVSFENEVFAFDQTLTHTGGEPAGDGVIYTPVVFKIIDVSDSSVTVQNADNGGSGHTGDEAHFVYEPSLAPDDRSGPRRLEFHNPEAQLFTFDAVITGRLAGEAEPATGSQPADGFVEPSDRARTFTFIEEFSGVVPLGSAGAQLVEGVDFVDVPFTAKDSANGVEGRLSASPEQGPLPDLDFELHDADGNVLDTSGNFGPNETVGAGIDGGETYVYRVVGWANGPATFTIESEQTVTDEADAGTGEGGEPAGSSYTLQAVRFTVDPLTGSVDITPLDELL